MLAENKLLGALLCVLVFPKGALSQFPIPSRYDGFAYHGGKAFTHPVVLEAFFDFLCPSCKAAWPVIKELPKKYGEENLQIIVHPFPAPFHHNAYFAARSVHIIGKLNSSLVYPWVEALFRHQDPFSNAATADEAPAAVVRRMAKLAAEELPFSSATALEQSVADGFMDYNTDYLTRVSFKYGCSRGVVATPTFLVNGVYVVGADDSWTPSQWHQVLDPLLDGISKRGAGVESSSSSSTA